MRAKEFVPASKPRNFVAKNQKTAGAGAHKDKKRAEKQGDVKHKKNQIPMEGLREFAPVGSDGGSPPRGPKTPGKDPWGGNDGPGDDSYSRPEPEYYSRSIDFFGKFEADHFDDEEFDKKTGVFKGYWDDEEGRVQIAYFKFDDPKQAAKDFDESPGMGWYYEPQNEGMEERVRDPEDWDEGNTEPGNNFAIYINGKKWKVFPGPYGAYADSPEEEREYYRLKDMARRKSEATGKKWEVYKTGEPATK